MLKLRRISSGLSDLLVTHYFFCLCHVDNARTEQHYAVGVGRELRHPAHFATSLRRQPLLGVNLGFGSLILLCGLGLGVLFEAFPLFQTFLKLAGSLYLLYLAYRIATASLGGEARVAQPFNFWEAAGFQYVSPKAWVMALTVMSAFAVPQLSFIAKASLITLLVMTVNLPCISAWALFGTAIGRFLTNRKVLMGFNFLMAGLLIATILLLF